MYIYNVTVTVAKTIQEEWLTWMKEIHIPEVLATKKFTHAKMLKVVADEGTEITYSIQYSADSKAALESYYTEDAPRLRQEAVKRFADKCAAFRTELEIISEHTAPF